MGWCASDCYCSQRSSIHCGPLSAQGAGLVHIRHRTKTTNQVLSSAPYAANIHIRYACSARLRRLRSWCFLYLLSVVPCAAPPVDGGWRASAASTGAQKYGRAIPTGGGWGGECEHEHEPRPVSSPPSARSTMQCSCGAKRQHPVTY